MPNNEETITCQSPYCQVPNLKTDFGEIKESMKSLHSKQDALLVMTADIKYIQETVKELKEGKVRDHENIFSRLHVLETTAVTKTDVAIFGGVMTAIFTIVSFLMRVYVR